MTKSSNLIKYLKIFLRKVHFWIKQKIWQKLVKKFDKTVDQKFGQMINSANSFTKNNFLINRQKKIFRNTIVNIFYWINYFLIYFIDVMVINFFSTDNFKIQFFSLFGFFYHSSEVIFRKPSKVTRTPKMRLRRLNFVVFILSLEPLSQVWQKHVLEQNFPIIRIFFQTHWNFPFS